MFSAYFHLKKQFQSLFFFFLIFSSGFAVKSFAQFSIPLCSTTLQMTNVGANGIICPENNPCTWSWSGPGLTFSCSTCQLTNITAPAPGTYSAIINFSGASNGSLTYSLTFGADDGDMDGFNDCSDCDDNNPGINPNTVWYLDADNDGYYTGTGITQCASPGTFYRYAGLIGGGDCNDSNPAVNPGAAEICDNLDNNCNNQVNEGLNLTYYRDADNDGFGNPGNTLLACSLPVGYVTNNSDCDDNNGAINPNTVWYLDADNDNYYTGSPMVQCTSPGTGYRYTGLVGGGDCNDGHSGINPGATEICDNLDNNCNNQTDEGVLNTFYRDMDGDSYGDPNISQQACSAPAGFVANNTDCDDNNPNVNPGTAEICDNLDNNCNNQVDDGINCCPATNIIYVNDDAPGNNDGASWTDAFNDLQDALALAGNCPNVTEIWVAAGTYKPTSGTDRSISFSMVTGVAIYGGFNGMETQLSERDWATYQTILSGDIGTVGVNTDNSKRIIYISSLGNTAILDGFTIRDSYNENLMDGNQGGGIWIIGASPVIRNCIVRNNNNASNGGGVAINNGSPEFINCLFVENATTFSGGAVRTEGGTPIITNCTFVGNTANYGASIAGNNFANITNHILKNCILWGNSATNGYNDIFNNSGATTTVTYSIVQDGYPGTGNLNEDPLFVDPANGNFRLQVCSPAIDEGDGAFGPSANTTAEDLDGNSRFYNNGAVDMGAYEYQDITIDPVNDIPPLTTQNGLSFDGTDDYVEVFDNCGDNTFFPGGNAITVAYWFKGTNGQSAVRMQNGSDFIVAAWNNSMHILSNDGGTIGVLAGNGFDDGNWHHMAFTWQRNTVNGFKSYLDGQLVDQRNSSDTPLPAFNSGFFLGSFGGNSEFMNGTIDEVGIWSFALDGFIEQIMCDGSNTFPIVLANWFDFDHGIFNGNNTGVELAQNLKMANAPGVLHNFALNGNSSNWVEGTTGPGDILFVNPQATGNNSGHSWTNAFTDLNDAFTYVNTCNQVTEIWVAAGTYKPTNGTNREKSFILKRGIAIYGGFNGTETSLSERDWVANETILSGDIGITGDNSDNSYNVIFNGAYAIDQTAILDGFIIQDGNASGSSLDTGYGGGIHNAGSSPRIVNCVFRNNQGNLSGGAVYNYSNSAPPVFVNCIFYNNNSTQGAGAMANINAGTVMTNCVFYDNHSGNANPVCIDNSGITPQISNSIIWGNDGVISGNPTVGHSIIEGGFSGAGNLDTDPLFIHPANHDFHLQNCSPAINAGNNNALPAGITNDFDGNSRVYNNDIIDMGVYEYQAVVDICTCFASGIIYVNVNATGINNGQNWTNAFTDLQDALVQANACSNITGIWVAAGTYHPTSGNDRSISFSMLNGVAIYGGFNGTETQLSERDWATYETILSGDIGTANDETDNSYHVISNNYNGLDNTAILNGFTISGGNANGSVQDSRGGGMYNSLSSPLVINCIFSANQSSSYGSGVFNSNPCTPTFINCLFANDLANQGGEVFNDIASARFQNCSFTGNSGLAIKNVDAQPTLINCIVWNNGGSISNSGSLSNVATVSYSIIQGGYPGTGNLNEDPLFVDPANGNFRLQVCSPGIDTGDGAFGFSANTTTEDLDGNPRFYNNGNVDMGAYELQEIPTPIVASCQNQTVTLNASGNASLSVAALDAGSDGCGALDFTVDNASLLSYGCSDVGGHNVMVTVTDETDQTATCSATITVTDNIAPVVSCGLNGIVTLNISEDDSEDCSVSYEMFYNLSDNCGSTILANEYVVNANGDVLRNNTLSLYQGSWGSAINLPVGEYTATITPTDGNENEGIPCSFTITVVDDEAPIALCQNAIIQLGALGTGSITTNDINNGSNDACGIASLSLSQTAFDCTHVGENSVTLTVTDNNTNESTCTATVTVQDKLAPQAICQNTTVQLDASGYGSITAADINNGSSDACGIGGLSLSQTTFDCSHVGTNTVTLTVIDNNDNKTDCMATVVVEDGVAPQAICRNPVVQLDAYGNGSISPGDIDNGSSDACGIAGLSASTTGFDCSNVGTNTVTLTVEDVNGNVNTCTATVTVEDNVAPNALCQNGVVKLNSQGSGSLYVFQINNGSNDACGVQEVSVFPDTFGCDDLGDNTVTLTVTDVNGNVKSCTANVNVKDVFRPQASCQNITATLNPEGVAVITPVEVNNGSADNCFIDDMTLDVTDFDCDDLGNNTVTLNVFDSSGNSDQCTATVSVVEGTGLPTNWTHEDIGLANGDASYTPCGGNFTVSSSGYPTPLNDIQHSAFQEICGNVEIIAHIESIVNPGWAGIEIRETLDTYSKAAQLKTQLGSFVRRVVRTTTGGYAISKQLFRIGHHWLRLVRTGDSFVGYTSPNGVNWFFAFQSNIAMDDCVYVGLFTDSYNANAATTAVFNHVSVTGSINEGLSAPVQEVTDISAEGVKPFDFNLYPNPADEFLNIGFNQVNGREMTLEIVDINGKRFYFEPLEDDLFGLDLDLQKIGMPAGMYQLNIRYGDTLISRRFVKGK